jgi:hypothetical protein
MRVEPSDTAALAEIAAEYGTGRVIQGQHAAFLELRVSDEQAVVGHIREMQCPGFRAPHSSDGQQPEEGTVGLGP